MKQLSLSLFFALVAACVFAQEPAANPTNMQFNPVRAYGFSFSFTPSTATGFLVLKSDKYITAQPVDGTTYEKGQWIGNSKVIASSSVTSFNAREVLENTKYYVAVFAYNGSGGSINYKQSNPLIDSVTSAAFTGDAYFVGIDSSKWSFVNDLHTLINPHTFSSYTPGYRTLMIPVLYERDTIGGGAVVTCEYSTVDAVYQPPFDFTAQAFNREHALPRSWMLTGGSTSNPDGADYHNLILTRDVPNQQRSNHPYGVVATVTSTFGESKYGKNAAGDPVFEPRNSTKGDAVRNMCYQMICYNGDGGNWGLNNLLTEATDQDQNIIKQWNIQDPPDKFERTKDEYIYSIQGNRNPFIAHPDWINCINWDSLVKTTLCGAISLVNDPVLNIDWKVFPNPATDNVNLHISSDEAGEAQLFVMDMAGRILTEEQLYITNGYVTHQINVSGFAAGQYLVKIAMDGKTSFRRLVVQ